MKETREIWHPVREEFVTATVVPAEELEHWRVEPSIVPGMFTRLGYSPEHGTTLEFLVAE